MAFVRKHPNELKKGDLVFMRIPFEENTTDYYNGWKPKEIRGWPYKNAKGETSKTRYAVVIGRENNSLIYLPLTSRRFGFDDKHQYVLQDNSMTYRKSPDMKSYVEVDSLRQVYVRPEWDIEYMGQLAENDMVNIMVEIGKRSIDFESKRDQRAYVSKRKSDIFEGTIKEKGYQQCASTMEQTVYKNKEGKTITKSKWGLVKYHVPLSKEEVTRLVAARENKPEEYYTKAVAERENAEFAKAVANMSNNSEQKRKRGKKMINGIIKAEDGFIVKDFVSEKVIEKVNLKAVSYEDAVEQGKKHYEPSFYPYLMAVARLKKEGRIGKEPDADLWENLVYAEDYRGVYDGEKKVYRNVTSLDRGAADEDEIDYIDALAFTYQSLQAIAG